MQKTVQLRDPDGRGEIVSAQMMQKTTEGKSPEVDLDQLNSIPKRVLGKMDTHTA